MHDRPAIELRTGDGDQWTLVFAHGRGASADGPENFVRQLGLDARVLLLQADDRTWYPNGFMAPLDENEPWLSAALEHYESAVSGLLSEGVDPAQIIVGGFSQGACLTAEWLARHPRRLGGAFILTGGLIGPEGTTWEPQPDLEDVPVYLSSALNDPWIPPSRSRETADWLRQSGADLQFQMFDEREHTVSEREIDDLRQLFAGA